MIISRPAACAAAGSVSAPRSSWYACGVWSSHTRCARSTCQGTPVIHAEGFLEQTLFVVPVASHVEPARDGCAIVCDVHLYLGLVVVIWCRSLVRGTPLRKQRPVCVVAVRLNLYPFPPRRVSTMAFLNSIVRLTDS